MPVVVICKECKKEVARIDVIGNQGIFVMRVREKRGTRREEFARLDDAYYRIFQLIEECPHCKRSLRGEKVKDIIVK